MPPDYAVAKDNQPKSTKVIKKENLRKGKFLLEIRP